ncbi:MAG: GFA family protein [Gammaproteobacteria bacterium]|nr:GFA family protein [Gammaproteobacteria bacterium]
MHHTGRCLCGAIRYEVSGNPNWVAICHCRDCQRSAGAPMVVWAMFPGTAVQVTAGAPKTINSSGAAMRSFCPDCGTGLFYRNADNLPGLVDVQASTLDNPNALPPTVQVQIAERQSWLPHLGTLAGFERFPSEQDV